MRIYTIYKIVNKINNKLYIGFTGKNPNKRLIEHKSAVNTGSDYALHEAMRKYGLDNFEFEVIYQSLDKNFTLNVMEPHFIEKYNSFINQNGYNMTYGGQGGMLDKTHSEETKNKMKIAWTKRTNRAKNLRKFTRQDIEKSAARRRGIPSWNSGKICPQISKNNFGHKCKGKTWRKDPETGKRVWI